MTLTKRFGVVVGAAGIQDARRGMGQPAAAANAADRVAQLAKTHHTQPTPLCLDLIAAVQRSCTSASAVDLPTPNYAV
jgi:hypothetical protein